MMKSIAFSFCLLQICAATLNDRPIIGILSQEPPSSVLEGETKNYSSYIPASYVKYIESAGARVVPIMINREENYYKEIASSVNGLLFPGGSNSIHDDSGYGRAGEALYKQTLERNVKGHYFPLWTTCLGFELLIYQSAFPVDLRSNCSASNMALPLITMKRHEKSRIFSRMPKEVYDIIIKENVTSNFHRHCYSLQDLKAYGLDRDYYFLSKNYDWEDFEFLSTIEHKTLPIYGTQWHPEKNPYEWNALERLSSIPHSKHAMVISHYFADFFVNEARLNNQKFINEVVEDEALIYHHLPKYTGNNTKSSFVQVYLFE